MAQTAMAARRGEERTLRRVGAGVLLSLAVHAGLMWAWRGGTPDAPPAPRPLAVRLQPPPSAPVVEPLPPLPPRQAARPPRAKEAAKPRSVIALPAQQDAPAEDFVVEQAPEPAPAETPRFDPDAARTMARSLANLRDPAREGTAVAQFPEKPLETESRAARAIGAAKRRNCKDGIPGGLLAPLILLADKKDSGCKW